MQVQVSYEAKRLCGYRKPSKDGVGIYLRGASDGEDCERLPFVLAHCPCCGGGIKPSRGFTWIDPMVLFDPALTPMCTASSIIVGQYRHDINHNHARCFVCNPESVGHRAGLIWIGEQHYKTPEDFMREVRQMGISRKIAALPQGFEVGKHVIYLGHRKVSSIAGDPDFPNQVEWEPGVFMAFRPTHIELVIDDPDKIPDKAIQLADRIGHDKVTILKVIPDGDDNGEDVWGNWSDE